MPSWPSLLGRRPSVSERIEVGPGDVLTEPTLSGVCARRTDAEPGPPFTNGSEYCWVHDPIRFPRVRGGAWRVQAA
jgi:hypothetical protein